MKKISLSRLRASRSLLPGRPPVRRPSLEPQALRFRPAAPSVSRTLDPRTR
jgi:hypothetical protein